MVAVHDTGLICAVCHGEVESHQTTGQPAPNPPSAAQKPAPPARSPHQRLYRFDAPHPPKSSGDAEQQPLSRSSHLREISPQLAQSDSPQLLSFLLLFFVGQTLVVWAFFQANVQALGIGIITSISAVGLALQSVNRAEVIKQAIEKQKPIKSPRNAPQKSPARVRVNPARDD